MTLVVSWSAVAALAGVLLICFVAPLLLYYAFYRTADGTLKMFLTGGAAYFAARFLLELPLSALLEYSGLLRVTAVYALYLAVLRPLIFVGTAWAVLRFLGKDVRTTGHALMTASGYVTLQNIVEVGLVSAGYLVTLWGIRRTNGAYDVISDADYVSMSDAVSRTDLLPESIFRQMRELCATPASYFVGMGLERLWIVAVHMAILTVIWLAVSRKDGRKLLGAAFGLRALAGLPALLSVCGVMKGGFVTGAVTVLVMLAVCAGAVVCWRRWIDREPVWPQEEETFATAD